MTIKLEELAKHFNVEVHYGNCIPSGPKCPACFALDTEPTNIEFELEDGLYACKGHRCLWCGTIFAEHAKFNKVEEQ